MTTRADLRSRVRAELNDAGAAQLWTDADLNRWLAEGVRAWSYDWPAERSTTLATAKGQPNYGLPGDLITVRRVEHPTGIYRAPVPFASGDVAPEARLLDLGCGVSPAELIYDVYNGVLWLSPAPDAAGESITVRYDGLWIVPSSDVTVLDLVSQDEDPVVWVACASALRWIGTDEAKPQRFERDRGANPLTVRRGFEQLVRETLARRRSRVGSRRLVARGEGSG